MYGTEENHTNLTFCLTLHLLHCFSLHVCCVVICMYVMYVMYVTYVMLCCALCIILLIILLVPCLCII